MQTNKIPSELLSVPRLEPQAAGLSAVLPVGRAVPIQFVIQDGREGIFLLGRFIESKVPGGVRDGERRRAEVVENQEALILKLLTLEDSEGEVSSKSSEPSPKTVIGTLSKVFSREEREILRKFEVSLAQVDQLTLPEAFEAKLKSDFERVGIFSDKPPSSVDVERLIERLMRGLAGRSEGDWSATPDEGGVENTAGNSPVVKLVRAFVRKLEEVSRDHLTASEVEDGAVNKASEDAEFQKDLPIKLGAKDAASLQRELIRGELGALIAKGTAVEKYLGANGALDLTRISGESGVEAKVLLLLGNLREQLAELGEEQGVFQTAVERLFKSLMGRVKGEASAPRAESIRAAVKQFIEEVSEACRVAGQVDGVEIDGVGRELERVARGAELVSDMSRCAQALGDSGFLVVPVLVGGVFSRWEIMKKIDDEGTEGAGAKVKGGEYRIYVELPRLGPVEVGVRVRGGGVGIRFVGREAEAVEKVRGESELLAKRLKEIGFDASVVARIGTPCRVVPSWYRHLTRTSFRC